MKPERRPRRLAGLLSIAVALGALMLFFTVRVVKRDSSEQVVGPLDGASLRAADSDGKG